jgi:hypothetical protein
MKQNMGPLDRVIRVIVALTIGIGFFTEQITGTAAIILGFLTAISLLTSTIGFCPLYIPFKFSTIKE